MTEHILASSVQYTNKLGKPQSIRRKRHGCAHSGKYLPEYNIWVSMRQRCENPKNKSFPRYGGKGICVCQEWSLFDNFIIDMGLRPTTEHSIERIDNTKGYSPGNCQWATRTQQARNKSDTRWLTYNGETKSLAEWAEQLGVDQGTMRARLQKGWTVERAVTTPLTPYKGHSLEIEYNGEKRSVGSLAKEFGLEWATLRGRLSRGWTVERAISTPPDQSRKPKGMRLPV